MLGELDYTPICFGEKTLLVMNQDGVCLTVNSQKYDQWTKEELREKINNAMQQICKPEQEKAYGMNTAYIFVTELCNLNCQFCAMRSDQKKQDLKFSMSQQMAQQKLIPLLQAIVPRKVIISGGEPLLHKDIIAIIRKLHDSLSSKIIIQTNGTMVDDYFINAVAGLITAIEISTSHYDDITVLKRSIKHFVEKNIQVTCSYMFEGDFDSLYHIIDFIANYDLGFILNFVAPTGSALDKNYKILGSEEKLFVFRKIAVYILKMGYSDKQLAEIFKTVVAPRKPCGAYGKIFAVFPDGKIYMCHSLKYKEYVIGDLLADDCKEIERNWKALLENENIKEMFRNDNIPECSRCKFMPICGGACMNDIHNKIAYDCTLRKIFFLYQILSYNANVTMEENLKNFLNFTDESRPYEKYMDEKQMNEEVCC